MLGTFGVVLNAEPCWCLTTASIDSKTNCPDLQISISNALLSLYVTLTVEVTKSSSPETCHSNNPGACHINTAPCAAQMESNDGDSDKSLLEIARYRGASIVSLMLDIQQNQLQQTKILSFIKNLECLSPEDCRSNFLFRRWVNAFDNKDYVALSYTWDASIHEDPSKGHYKIQSRDRLNFYQSRARNCVFERTLKYMSKFHVSLLWMDRHCIRQWTCGKIECTHRECTQKQCGLQTMDLVYALSGHPLALLGRPIETAYELELLAKILSGKFVFYNRQSGVQLSKETTRLEATMAILLLKEMTSDLWWRRAWIFQESYRAGSAMSLLISHPRSLEKQKRSYDIELFQDIYGELCINAVKFSYEATRICLAVKRTQPVTTEESDAVNHVFSTAARYSVLLENHQSMTPVIVSDVEKREVKFPWDRLAIVANCCQYPVRLDIQELAQKEQSVSLSMLTMCLLNGEILWNKEANGSLFHMTVSEFLRSQSFKGFYAPIGSRSLSFNKGCRFIHTSLTQNGVFTKGHIWKLGGVIDSHELKDEPSWVKNPAGRLSLHERKRLIQLANKLRSLNHFLLERQIIQYLQHDSYLSSEDGLHQETFAASYMRIMASELVRAIDCGVAIRLGSLWEPSGRPSPYRAIFIWDHDVDQTKIQSCEKSVPSHRNRSFLVFTASRPEIQVSDGHDANDMDRHVSLEVRHEGYVEHRGRATPRLLTDRWIAGLCFFEGLPRTAVIFPWPPGLEEIGS